MSTARQVSSEYQSLPRVSPTFSATVAGVKARWHDMRHSAVSQVAAGGATDGTLQSIFGWMSPEMIERYSRVRNAAKRKAVAVLDGLRNRKRSPQNPPQRAGSPQKHSDVNY
jgi:hypothetical protein